eukprot:2072437-Rhodomonas_salina.1
MYGARRLGTMVLGAPYVRRPYGARRLGARAGPGQYEIRCRPRRQQCPGSSILRLSTAEGVTIRVGGGLSSSDLAGGVLL